MNGQALIRCAQWFFSVKSTQYGNIYYNRQYMDSKDKQAVMKALNEDLITGEKMSVILN